MNHLWIDFESTLNRFCNDFESTLNRLWINFESTLNQHWINFESTLNQWEACRINLTNFWWEFVEKLLDNNLHCTFSKILSNIRWTCKACTKPMCHGYLDNASWFFVIQFQDFMLVVPKFPVLFQSPFHTWLFQKLAKAYVWGELEEIRGKKSTTPPRGRGEARFYRIWCFRWKFGKNERVQTTSILCFNVLFFQLLFFALPFDKISRWSGTTKVHTKLLENVSVQVFFFCHKFWTLINHFWIYNIPNIFWTFHSLRKRKNV